MELLELTTKIKELFAVEDLKELGSALESALNDESKLDAFVELVGGDLSVDWLQRVYQYYLADRDGKKQDFTPPCLAELLSELVGDCDLFVDLCAGTGALSIARWKSRAEQRFVCAELDESVVPYLLFNLVVRNMDASVRVGDVLDNDWRGNLCVRKGEEYGIVESVKRGFDLDAPRCVVSNPPYNIKFDAPLARLSGLYSFGTPPAKCANYGFVLAALRHSNQKAALLLPNCVLSPADEEKGIVANLIEHNLLRAVVALPPSMFESTQIPVCVLLLDHKKETLKVEFVDLTSEAKQETREQRGQFGGASHTGRVYKKTVNVLTSETIKRAVDAIANASSESNFCAAVEPEEIVENGLDLSPKRYVRAEREKVEYRSFKDIAADFNRVIREKNAIRIKFNRTAAKRLGFDCLERETIPDFGESFALVGCEAVKEDFVSFTNSDGIEVRVSTKDGDLPLEFGDFLRDWNQRIRRLNNEENRYLAEFRDALLPKLMSGEIDVSKLGD